MSSPALTLYYDGKSPFCSTEMARLRHWDAKGRLAFADISAPGFDPQALGVDMAALNREIYSRTEAGTILVGTQSILAAYALVGRGWMVLPLRVPGLRDLLSWMYRLFARHRYTMSRLLGYNTPPRCESGTCFRDHS